MGEPVREHDLQGPTTGTVATEFDLRIRIVTHPAFRLGFLDAQSGAPFSHDNIMARIERETPSTALKRIRWRGLGLFDEKRAKRTEMAQYRYEEGRLAVIAAGLKCRSWNHPDYPPKQVVEFARDTRGLHQIMRPNA